MNEKQERDDVAIDPIPVDVSKSLSDEVDPSEIADEIDSLTRALASDKPPTNPLVVLKAARWWYIHGKGGTDPAFRWAVEWTRHLATDAASDAEQFDAFLTYLVELGVADEQGALRTPQ
ncbi:hypothetical protein MBEHAL_1258 [Halarchaeum acidiphilum MH1-52-1]|uniref:DUF8013 domain-containing protein n=1 Tax=Halarchaeum acidiphilum MH1-52-1 TaxID=1261545 RepID=U3ACJ6_9EURY|nr:hypothetical protein [Halarchaeum acidiphilum]GAD52498.1 hypothetical protein MBEHAL_1258 [Halarchaeum acidiphilum MH1-52-1]